MKLSKQELNIIQQLLLLQIDNIKCNRDSIDDYYNELETIEYLSIKIQDEIEK